MKILMLNTFDNWGGAAKAAYRLHHGIRGLGFDSRLLVQFKDSNDPNVIGPKNRLLRIINGIESHLDRLPGWFYPSKPDYNFTPGFMPNRLATRVAGLKADILHLHWLAAGFCRLETLQKLRRPIIWTLHDSWAFTGGCHVPHQCVRYRQMCGACPVLGSSKEKDISRWVWRRKKRAWQGLNLRVVTPSRWLAGCARSSSLFRNRPVEVIPNGLDLSLFKPSDKPLAREQFGLPPEKKLILFGGMDSTSDRNKGFHLLVPALQKLAHMGWHDAAELLVFGAPEPVSRPPFGLKAHYLGWLHDDVSLALLYSAADLFVAPSMLENLPNTVMEAMACGTPCVAFEQGGMTDLIEHERTGYLARAYEPDHLAMGIDGILKDEDTMRAMAERSRQRVEEKFDLAIISKKYVSLYREMLSQRKGQQE